MANLDEILKKKVVGIPVLYLAGGFVAILAVVAWKLKAAPEPTPPDAAGTDDGTGAPELAGSDSAYDGYNTNGTVVVQPSAPTGQPPVEETNETWLSAAITYVVKQKLATPGFAQEALTKYLDGNDLSFSEGQIRDAALNGVGIPPESLGKIGATATAPARKQFSQYPGTHTVKGGNDNTAGKLAVLYYGADHATDGALKIASVNLKMGPATTTYPTGTKIQIPAYVTPGTFTATKTTTHFKDIAAKSGTTADVVRALNPNLSEPFAVGTKVRVH